MGSLIFENTVYVNDPTWNSVNNSTVRTKTIFGKSAVGRRLTTFKQFIVAITTSSFHVYRLTHCLTILALHRMFWRKFDLC